MPKYDLTIKALEDVQPSGESMSPPRMVAGSFIYLDVADEDGTSIWSDCVAVQDPMADPEDIARAALETAGFGEIEIADEWSPVDTSERAGSSVSTTGTVTRDAYTTCRIIHNGGPSERREIATDGSAVSALDLAEHLGAGHLESDANLYSVGWIDTPDAYWFPDDGEELALYS
jgi:hypothetical protein